jgi:tetratricopeptide (TPR) repeat protein
MSHEWYVLFGNKIRGPATAAQLRKALADGKIQQETLIRAGADGEWTFVRDLPEISPVPQTAARDGDDSVVLDNSNTAQAAASRGLSNRLLLVGSIVVVALGGGVFAGIQLSRPSEAKHTSSTAIDSDVAPRRSETYESKTAPVSPPAILPVAKVTEVPKVVKSAEPLPPKRQLVEPAEKTVRVASVAMQDSRSGGGSDLEPRSTSRDSFDIPWPNPQRDSIAEQMDWEKLDSIIREHNKLFEQWKRQRHNYQELANHLMKVGNDLQGLQNRADSVAHTMNKIRGAIGDQNADDADVFAPPETPRWVQSLAKTYTLRTGEMDRLNAKATRAVNDFNATLAKLDTNISNQKRTLSRATELRGEWVRVTRPFGVWTKQDLPIPLETSTRWILNNDSFAPAFLARCVAEIHEKNYDKAGEDIAMAIKRDPFWVELYALQAVLQDRAGKRAEVDKSFKMVRRFKNKPAFVEVCEGIISANHHIYDRARNKFGAAAKHDPSDPAGPAELALLLLTYPKTELRDPASAVEAATAACKATSWNHWWCLDVLSISYAATGDFDRAIGCTQRAKRAAPSDVQQHLDERIASYKKKEVPSAAVGDL